MKAKIVEIITKRTPETTYIDGANAADEILALFSVEVEELENYWRCNTCGDYFDMRNLDRVTFHESCENAIPYKPGQALKK